MHAKNMEELQKVIGGKKLDIMETLALKEMVQANRYLKYFYNGISEAGIIHTSYVKTALDYYLSAKEKLQDNIDWYYDPFGFTVSDISNMLQIISGSGFKLEDRIGSEIKAETIIQHLETL